MGRGRLGATFELTDVRRADVRHETLRGALARGICCMPQAPAGCGESCYPFPVPRYLLLPNRWASGTHISHHRGCGIIKGISDAKLSYMPFVFLVEGKGEMV